MSNNGPVIHDKRKAASTIDYCDCFNDKHHPIRESYQRKDEVGGSRGKNGIEATHGNEVRADVASIVS